MFLVVMLLFSCSKENIEPKTNIANTIIWAEDDFYISEGSKAISYRDKSNVWHKEILVGWDDDGNALRSIIGFDISSLQLPNDSLVIYSAKLKVYESNTLNNPFDNGHKIRAYILNEPVEGKNAFACKAETDCGVLTDYSGGLLYEYTLDITDAVFRYRNKGCSNNGKLYFRLQLDFEDLYTIPSGIWGIVAREDTFEHNGVTFAPKLELEYYYLSK